MLGTSLIAMLSQIAIPWILKSHLATRAQLLGVSHVIAAIALLSTLRIDEFSSIFVILPLTGFSVATILDLPEQIAEQLENEFVMECENLGYPHRQYECQKYFGGAKNQKIFEKSKLHIPVGYKQGIFSRMLGLSTLLGQIVMFSVVPGLFLYWPQMDDNIWGLASAGIAGAVGAFFAFLL